MTSTTALVWSYTSTHPQRDLRLVERDSEKEERKEKIEKTADKRNTGGKKEKGR